jgi:hypothetical protein
MRVGRGQWVGFSALVGLLSLALGACTDEEVVYGGPDYEQPPSNAASFIGYSSAADTLPVCGNCHVGQHSDWKATPHARAFETLQTSGGMEGFCQACHTVNNLGNATTDTTAGWRSTKDARYHDVQCESCHGPGLTHVQNPSVEANQPMASINVSTTGTNGCGECHNGAHHPYVDEWARSRHGRPQPNALGKPECEVCHEGIDVLKGWGINTTFLEQNGTAPMAITCAVCHDPHGTSGLPKQVRFPIDVPSEETNMCMKCHHKRGTPDMANQSRGPHSPEGPVLLGYGGWWPPNMQGVDTILATHGSSSNPTLCTKCHVDRYEVTDPTSGDFLISVAGHTFKAIPCVNAQGVPTTDQACTNIAQRTFRSCTGSGCHNDAGARSAYQVATARIADLTNRLSTQLTAVPATEFNSSDTKYTTGEGAKFNRDLGAKKGSAIHNPFLLEALLRASMQQVTKDYGIPAPAGTDLSKTLYSRHAGQ